MPEVEETSIFTRLQRVIGSPFTGVVRLGIVDGDIRMVDLAVGEDAPERALDVVYGRMLEEFPEAVTPFRRN